MMNKITTARFETGKRGLIAGAGCTGDRGPWIVPGDRCEHILSPKEGVEYSVEIIGQSKQGNLRFCRVVSTAALVKSVEREVQEVLSREGLATNEISFRRGTIHIESREGYDYRSCEGRPQDSWNFAARVTVRAELSEFPGAYIEVLARNVPLLGAEGLARKREVARIAREEEEAADRRAKEEFWTQLPEWVSRDVVYDPQYAHKHFTRETEFPESVEWHGGESSRGVNIITRWCKIIVVLLSDGDVRMYRRVADDDLIVVERTTEEPDDDEEEDGGEYSIGSVIVRFRDASHVQGIFWVTGENVFSCSDQGTWHENHLWLRE